MAEEASVAMAGLAKLESYLKRAVQRRDLVTDNKEQLRELLGIYDHAIQELERLRHSRLHDIDNVNTTIRQRIEEHKQSLLANRQELQSLQPHVERSHFWMTRVRRHRQLLGRCNAVVQSCRQFYDSTLRPSLERCADLERELKWRENNRDIETAQASNFQTTNVEQDSYLARRIVPLNPPRLTLNYGTTNTYEGKLKAEILDSLKGGNRIVGVVARGLGGVGKTCALRGLADDKQIREIFPGGILYIQLGNDSHLSDIISGIAKCVQRTGGERLAKTIRSLQTVEDASDTAGQWFAAHRCLFLLDDVWEVNGITPGELRKLGSMLNDVSLLVYTSRARAIDDSGDKTVVFEEREVRGEISRNMLMNHANIGCYEDLSTTNREAVDGILDACQGLPLAFGIAGATVRRYCVDGVNQQNAWSEYYHDLMVKEECIVTGSTTQYGSVWLVVSRSLDVLDSRSDKGRKFTDKFRGLCVLQKQQSVNGQVLQKLWNLESVRQARELAGMLESVSLIRMVRKRENQFTIRVHDLIIDIATQMNSESERIGWFRTLVDNYIPKRQIGSGEAEIDTRGPRELVATPWWSVADDGFLHDNICRVLKEAGLHQEVLWLLERARWVVMRLQTGGIGKVEQELKLGMSVAESCSSDKKEAVKYLELVKSAARGSWFAVDEAWFQLYGRLVWHSRRCKRTRNFLAEIEKHAPRPWVKPSIGVLKQAGGTHSERILIAEEYGCVICMCGAGCMIQILQNKGIVTEYDRISGTQKKHTLFVKKWIRSAAFSDDGERLVTVDSGGKVVLWNSRCGYCVEKHLARSGDIEYVRISGDGQTVSYGSRRALFVVEANGETHHKTLGETIDSQGVIFRREEIGMSFTGRRIMFLHSHSAVCNIHVWDIDSDEDIMVQTDMKQSEVKCVAISKDGERVVYGSGDGGIGVWNVQGAQNVIRTWKGHSGRVDAIVFSPDGKRIFSAGSHCCVRVWDSENGAMAGDAVALDGTARVIEISQSGREAVVHGVSGTGLILGARVQWVIMLDMRKLEVGNVAKDDAGLVKCVAYCGHGKEIVTGCGDGRVRVWDADSGAIIGRTLEGNTEEVSRVAVSADGSRIVSASQSDGIVRVWDANSRRAVALRRVPREDASGICRNLDVAVNHDGTQVVYACGIYSSNKGTVEVWHVQSDTVTTVTRDAHADTCVAISFDGGRIAFESQNGHSLVTTRAMSSDGARESSTPEAPRPSVIELDDFRLIMLLLKLRESRTRHSDRITSLAFSADGTRVVSASKDKTVRVWDVATGEAIGQPFRHDEEVHHVQTNRHGSHVVSYNARGYGQLWDVERAHCVINSSHREWTPYLHRLGVAAFESSPTTFGHSFVNNISQNGIVQATLETFHILVRVGQLYWSYRYSSSFWQFCRIMYD